MLLTFDQVWQEDLSPAEQGRGTVLHDSQIHYQMPLGSAKLGCPPDGNGITARPAAKISRFLCFLQRFRCGARKRILTETQSLPRFRAITL